MLRRLYDWTMALAGRPRARWALGAVSFIESSVFPIPPDVILIPMVLARRQAAWTLALICTGASVLGALLGYAIGFYLFQTVGQPILDFYGYQEAFARFQAGYNDYGGWVVAFFGLTPFPYKVITIASGVTELNIATFIVASVVSRGARFFIVAGLLWRFGEPIRAFIERYLGLLTLAFFILLFAGFAALKLLI